MSGLFVVICLIWGATWLAMKFGVASVPPVFFGGTRFVVAGLVLLLLAWWRGELRRLDWPELHRLVRVQLLMLVLTYAPLFWAIRHVPSGLTAVLDLALTPLSLLGFGIALGEEHWTLSRGMALGFGFAGLAVLFGPQIVAPTDPPGLLGAAAIVFSAVVYSLGSVMARPLTKTISPIFLSGLTLLPGGLMLTLGALAFEPKALDAARFDWSAAAWGGWLFLVTFGSLVAFTAYLRLIAVWGPARAGSYAYVSPVIAVLLGMLVLGEQVGLRQGLGMALLLVAAFCSLHASVPKPWRAWRRASADSIDADTAAHQLARKPARHEDTGPMPLRNGMKVSDAGAAQHDGCRHLTDPKDDLAVRPLARALQHLVCDPGRGQRQNNTDIGR